MPRHGNATSPDAPLIKDPLIKENADKGSDLGHSNEKIYVDLARREGKNLSETIRDPRVVSNHRNNSQATHSKVKYSETECIVRYLKTNDNFVKTFSLDREQYSAFNYIHISSLIFEDFVWKAKVFFPLTPLLKFMKVFTVQTQVIRTSH